MMHARPFHLLLLMFFLGSAGLAKLPNRIEKNIRLGSIHEGKAIPAHGDLTIEDPDTGKPFILHITMARSDYRATLVRVYVAQDSFTDREEAAIESILAMLNTVAPYWKGRGLRIERVEGRNASVADIWLQKRWSSDCGAAIDGILGCAELSPFFSLVGIQPEDGHPLFRPHIATVNLTFGWKWYAGKNPNGIKPHQFDFQTVMTQELLHALGIMGHDEDEGHSDGALNGDGHSVMFPSIKPGHTHRELSKHDIETLRHLYGYEPISLFEAH